MDKSFNLIALLKLILKWKKSILIVCTIAIVGSTVITDPHIMKPYYASTSIFLPSNPNQTSSQNMFVENQAGPFGSSDDVDRMLQFATSPSLQKYVVQRFHLFQHYDIDSASEAYPNYAVQQELEDNVNVEKNDKGAIEVTVYDYNKDTAAAMANAIVNQVDEINKTIINDNKQKMLAIYENKISLKEKELETLSDSIVAIKQTFGISGGIQDLRQSVNASNAMNSSAYEQASESLKILDERKKGALKELNNSVGQYEQFKATISKDVPTVYILEKAYPAEKKAKPIRWLTVLSATIVAFVISVLTIIVIDRYQDIKEALTDD